MITGERFVPALPPAGESPADRIARNVAAALK